MSDTDEEILKEFVVESYDNLDNLDREFVALEADPGARERLAAIFRTIHTVKGNAGFLGFAKLEKLAHAGETLLSRLRDGELTLTPEATSTLLTMVDGVRALLKNIETTGDEGTNGYESVLAALGHLLVVPSGAAPQASRKAAHAPGKAEDLSAASTAGDSALEVRQEESRQENARDESPSADVVETKASVPAAETARNHATTVDTSVRVDVALLDKLMNLVGELVLARNQILQFSAQGKDAGLIGTSQRLNLITTELQEGVMKTRMQPIGSVWSKFPRIVRDLALFCGKQVRLEMSGEDTELDRTIIEAIKDPLTHLVRNSIDHGIEPADLRTSRGKPASGRLFLRAFHEGGQVNIEISDDGGGIDPDRVRRKAVDRGLISVDRASQLSDREVLNLIFVPGFSTADKVTNVSGRGVGMDVVKTNIEKIGGTVEVQSKLGQGTTLKIKIPLTLAIIPALIVTSHEERFAIPQVSLLELVRLEGDQALKCVESVHGAPVYRLRGKLLPLVYLNQVLGLTNEVSSEAINIVVVQADDSQFGLVVDTISDTEEIVVKPLGKELKWLATFAGATIMGDGRVALILDVPGIAQRANALSERADRKLAEVAIESHDSKEEKQALLLFRARQGARMAIPLSTVARLEEFAPERLERTGSQQVVQYRGEILPLIDLRGCTAAETQPLQVIVAAAGGQSVGLIVEAILDIIEEHITVQRGSSGPDTLGAAVIHGKVTDLLDVREVVRQELPTLFHHSHAA